MAQEKQLRKHSTSSTNWGMQKEMTRNKGNLPLPEKQLQFEMLLANISAGFINLPADQIDNEIENAQRQVCEFLDLDLCAVWQQLAQDKNDLMMTHAYFRTPGTVPPDYMQISNYFPWYWKQIQAGKTQKISSLTELPADAAIDRKYCEYFGIKSNISLPLMVGGKPPFGLLGFNTTRVEHSWPDKIVMQLKLVAQVFANAIQRKRMEDQLRERLQEIEELKERLERENTYLREEVKFLGEHTDMVGQSLALKKVLLQAEQVAQTESTVLILGETGTGKELLAKAIHRMSLRKDKPMVTINCASLPPTLIESELFGREKGAYTGALTKMIGRFEIADSSTLFLDEIGEIPLDMQSKLLRVIEEGAFERLGSSRPMHVNVRIITATNRDIEQEVNDGKFRRDLFYRLNVFPIVIPPLRDRPEDIPLLVRAIVREFQKRLGKEIESIPKKTMQALQSYSWPGNVRELRNVIEHAMIMNNGKILEVQVPGSASLKSDDNGKLNEIERKHIAAVLEKTRWRIAGPGGAAEVLGLKRTTLQAKMKKLGISRSRQEVPK